MVFRSMGVPYKQWDPGIVCPWRSCLHVGMMEQANPLLHQFIYVALGFSFPHREHLIGWTYSLHSSGIFSFMMFLWDLGTLSRYFIGIEVGMFNYICSEYFMGERIMIRVVQQKHDGPLGILCLRTSNLGKGGLSCSHFDSTMK